MNEAVVNKLFNLSSNLQNFMLQIQFVETPIFSWQKYALFMWVEIPICSGLVIRDLGLENGDWIGESVYQLRYSDSPPGRTPR
jgi:hypothetical protein